MTHPSTLILSQEQWNKIEKWNKIEWEQYLISKMFLIDGHEINSSLVWVKGLLDIYIFHPTLVSIDIVDKIFSWVIKGVDLV